MINATNAAANTTSSAPLDIDKMIAIAKQVKQDTADRVAKLRAGIEPCPVCGHVMEVSNDGGSVTVCPCIYHEFQKLPQAEGPVPLSAIKIFVKNTERAPYRILDFTPPYGPSPLEASLPLKKILNDIEESMQRRLWGIGK